LIFKSNLKKSFKTANCVQKPRHPVGRVHDQIVDGEAGQADADAERRDGGVLPDLKEKINMF
jgi:hypothetical protein